MSKLLKHLRIIHKHRKYVRQACWKMGLFWQGLTHDLSKYSPKEFSIYKFYVGTRSPHAVARDEIGYSPSWINHYHINKHHWQYWLDMEDWPDKVIPVKMPYKYVVESLCDMLGASKAYNPKDWKPIMLYDYWTDRCKGKRLMHPESEYLLEKLIWNLYERGEQGFFKWYKRLKKSLETRYNDGVLMNEMYLGV